MSSIVFGLTVGVIDPDEVAEVLALCRRIADEHPDMAPEIERHWS
jgi:hypothetical protein